MRRLRGGARVLDVVGVPVRTAGVVEVSPAWTRTGGWAEGQVVLGAALAEREVPVPWLT